MKKFDGISQSQPYLLAAQQSVLGPTNRSTTISFAWAARVPATKIEVDFDFGLIFRFRQRSLIRG
jgi:hypothetical protein